MPALPEQTLKGTERDPASDAAAAPAGAPHRGVDALRAGNIRRAVVERRAGKAAGALACNAASAAALAPRDSLAHATACRADARRSGRPPLLCAAQVDEDVVCGLNQRFRDCYDVDSCDVVVTGIFHQVGTAGREPPPACRPRAAACRERECRKLALVSGGTGCLFQLSVP